MNHAEILYELLQNLKHEQIFKLQAELQLTYDEFLKDNFYHIAIFSMVNTMKSYLKDYAIEGTLKAIAMEILNGNIDISLE